MNFHPLFRRAAEIMAWLAIAFGATGCVAMQGNRVALVIGNSAYTSVPALKNPVHDKEDVCAEMSKLGFRTLCHDQVRTRADFEALVTEYVDALKDGSTGFFLYSGHGVQKAGQNYLVPTDAGAVVSGDPLQQLYPLDDLFAKLRRKRSLFTLVVLDACRSDPFAAGAGSEGRRAAFTRTLEVVGQASYGTALINDAPPGTMVLYATASRDTASDGAGRNGPLTKHFLRFVGVRGMTVEDLTKNVIRGVQDETREIFGKEQTPYVYASLRRPFCFAGCFDPTNFRVPPTN